jgi:hypothetical protein
VARVASETDVTGADPHALARRRLAADDPKSATPRRRKASVGISMFSLAIVAVGKAG